MPTRPDSRGTAQPPLVVAVQRRLAAAHLLDAGSVAIAIGAVAAAVGRARGWTIPAAAVLVAAVAGALTLVWFAVRRSHRSARAAASLIERARPECRNVVVTAVELSEHPARARPWIRERVSSDAVRILTGLDPGVVVPLTRRAAVLAMAAAVAVAAIATVDERAAGLIATIERARGARGTAPANPYTVVVTLQPPAHTRLPAETISEPGRIGAVEGTRMRMTIGPGVEPPRVRFGNLPVATREDRRTTIAELTLRESGYLAIETAAAPRLIPVVVTPDRAPAITIEKPGRDLLVSDAARTIALEASATDDFGLELFSLRYTKVSGSGEQFEFVEGELPLAVSRQNSRAWRGRGELALARLRLEPGDSLVYRVVARDARPGDAGFASSDTFFVEVAGPGQVALEGFEMPPESERSALSQQMIVLKIQRLRERERSLARAALEERTGAIAAEQRAVRANFVFLMGGHVEDEEEEAAHSHEIQEGRLENTAQREISRAIGHMSHAERLLVAVDTAAALEQARLAAAALQRAFGRNRYILRALPVRSRVDPSRRLTGKLDDARGWTRNLPRPSRDARAQAIRDLLAGLMAFERHLTNPGTLSSAPAIPELMERALAIDPADPRWQQVSARLGALRDTIAAGGAHDAVRRQLAEALSLVAAQARAASAPAGFEIVPPHPLRGSWAAELRR